MEVCGSIWLVLAKVAAGGSAGLVVGKEIGIRGSRSKHGRTPAYKGADMTRRTPYEQHHDVNKFLKQDFIRDFNVFGKISTPAPLLNRTSWHAENVPTYNDLAGSMYSVTAYENTRDLYYTIVNGDAIPSAFDFATRQRKGGKSIYRDEHKPELIKIWGNTSMKLIKSLYKIPDSHVKYMTPKSINNYRTETSPGWMQHSTLATAAGWAYKGRTTANYRAVIYNRNVMYTHNEHPVKDKHFKVSLTSHESGVSTEVAHPFQGIKTDSLDSNANFQQGYVHEGFQLSLPGFCTKGPHSTTLQEMIGTMEALGIDWVAYSEKGMHYPTERHKLYTANFPYRGLTKKAVGEKGFIRQKGGNSKRVVEWHPRLQNHYDNKTDEEVFA